MLSMGSHGLGFVLIVSGSDHVRRVVAKIPNHKTSVGSLDDDDFKLMISINNINNTQQGLQTYKVNGGRKGTRNDGYEMPIMNLKPIIRLRNFPRVQTSPLCSSHTYESSSSFQLPNCHNFVADLSSLSNCYSPIIPFFAQKQHCLK
jgi:hypothetical protein